MSKTKEFFIFLTVLVSTLSVASSAESSDQENSSEACCKCWKLGIHLYSELADFTAAYHKVLVGDLADLSDEEINIFFIDCKDTNSKKVAPNSIGLEKLGTNGQSYMNKSDSYLTNLIGFEHSEINPNFKDTNKSQVVMKTTEISTLIDLILGRVNETNTPKTNTDYTSRANLTKHLNNFQTTETNFYRTTNIQTAGEILNESYKVVKEEPYPKIKQNNKVEDSKKWPYPLNSLNLNKPTQHKQMDKRVENLEKSGATRIINLSSTTNPAKTYRAYQTTQQIKPNKWKENFIKPRKVSRRPQDELPMATTEISITDILALQINLTQTTQYDQINHFNNSVLKTTTQHNARDKQMKTFENTNNFQNSPTLSNNGFVDKNILLPIAIDGTDLHNRIDVRNNLKAENNRTPHSDSTGQKSKSVKKNRGRKKSKIKSARFKINKINNFRRFWFLMLTLLKVFWAINLILRQIGQLF